MIVALLLSPDDVVLSEMTLPTFRDTIRVALPPPRNVMFDHARNEGWMVLGTVEFDIDWRESLARQLLHGDPAVYAYRQRGFAS